MSHKNIFPDSTINEPGGWRNTVGTRNHGIELLKDYIQNELIQIPDVETIKELMHFIYQTSANDLSKAKAQAARKGQPKKGVDHTGLFDDRVFSLIGALLADKSLPPVLTPRERAIENQQTDHDIVYSNEYDLQIETPAIEIPFDGLEFG